jgi:DHA1 family multidrug resistance protein-like MFS transporter
VVDWKRNLSFLWIAQFLSLLGFSFALPFAPFYFQELGVTGRGALRVWTGLFAAGSGIPLAIAAPIWGALADRYGRRPMSLRASLAGALVLSGMALARTPGMLLALRVLQGIFTGTITANLTLVVSSTPEKRIGLAVGIMNSAVFAGDTLAPLFGGLCADRFGYRVGFAISGLSLLLSFLVTLLFVREDFQRPQGRSVLPSLRLAGRPAELRTGARGALAGALRAVAPFLPVTGLIALGGFARYLATPQYPLLVQEIAAPSLGLATQTGLVNAAAGVAVVLAGILFGRLADRSVGGVFLRLGAASSLGAAMLTAALAAARSLGALIPLRMGADFCAGGADNLLNVVLARRADAGRRGLAFGLAGSVRSAAWALGAMAGGLLSAAAGFWAVFLLGGASFLVLAWLFSRISAGIGSRKAIQF